MNQELYDALMAKLAAAHAAVTEVSNAAHQNLGYERTRKWSRRALNVLESLCIEFSEEWDEDERELTSDLKGLGMPDGVSGDARGTPEVSLTASRGRRRR